MKFEWTVQLKNSSSILKFSGLLYNCNGNMIFLQNFLIGESMKNIDKNCKQMENDLFI